MKRRILAAIFCVCLALTSLYIPALADDTEPEMSAPVEDVVEMTPAPVEEMVAPVTYATSSLSINGTPLGYSA